ncbi:MAG: RtcB family protein [Candidatus Marsarchaeota archaeon]|nr:RtcB family protein [Candidatus Marsarchaeota archaeon]
MEKTEIKTRKISEVKFRIEKEDYQTMNTDVDIFAKEDMLLKMKQDRTLQQAVNTAALPGIVGNVLVMPDGHEGYGFPVGGVVAFDAEEGIISPGICGFDINCGIRIIKTNLDGKDIRGKISELSDALFRNVPSGVGSRKNLGFNDKDLEKVATYGVEHVIDKGFGFSTDSEKIEENGMMDGADFRDVSKFAKARGLHELGTLGAGNHFLEIQEVSNIYDDKAADVYGVSKGQAVIMIHTGSRGFGHQICSDYLRVLEVYGREHEIKLPDPELSYAPVDSKEAKAYLGAMKCAVNYAFTNRQMITYAVRKSFEDVFGKSADSLGMDILYDLAHNIVKLEEHRIEGRKRSVFVHRKGATRAFPKGSSDVPKEYRDIGQPVLIPGSMSTASYVLAGEQNALEETFGSACHGSGRVMSRHQAIREIPASRTFETLKKKGVEIRIRSRKLVSEEAEWAYKNVDEVVEVVDSAGIASMVSRNVPVVVVKG